MANTINPSEIELFVISRIKKMRVDAGMSQASFALEMNLSYGFIGQVENPNRRAKYNLNHLNQAAKVFKCSVKDFFPENPF
ncbi:helix-turn-helix transcriptional regulator [Pedobacter riviphilus]|uniref:Helix-turn-helix transcriptional regulator n=1 Tax=Pedobacter riviphilus TaxID=2766984 RepID=A0ABX6TMF3_9SPHI|nr:helix-turn-helix transcriptional regulator [Pedobacter riviphilus]QNR86748.1 helix-turn-helix transcriptional regulator [Pedobacter riviphilus]